MRAILISVFVFLFHISLTASESAPSWFVNSKQQGWSRSDLVKAYFHNSELQRQWAWQLMAKQALSGDEKILDFGCGDGKISAELSHFVPYGSVKGVDISSEMVQFAMRKFPPYAYPNLTFSQSQSFTFEDAIGEHAYDLICSFCVFHQVPKPLELLKNLKGHLKEEGKLVLVIPAGRNPALFQAAEEVAAKYEIELPWKKGSAPTALTMRTLEGCTELLSQAGYKILSLERIDTDTPFYDKEELVDYMVGTMTANWNTPASLLPDFYQEVTERMCKIDPEMIDQEGRLHFKLSRIHVVATPN